jgi:hypothetical protein
MGNNAIGGIDLRKAEIGNINNSKFLFTPEINPKNSPIAVPTTNDIAQLINVWDTF